MAEKDFADIGVRELFTKALEAVQWVVRIGKHLGSLTQKKFSKTKFRNNNEEIGIENSDGEYLFIPTIYLKMFIDSPPTLLRDIAEIVQENKRLAIGVVRDGTGIEEEITYRTRYIFTQEEDEATDVVLPELEHNQVVTLDGNVTRGNEVSNTIVNSTRKCNSTVLGRGPAAVPSWLDLTHQSERSTHERIYAADPRGTIPDLHPEESRALSE